MDNHIAEFLAIIDRLRDMGEEYKEHKVEAFLLGSLVDNCHTIVSALEVRSEEDLTLDMVKEKLLQEAKRQCEASTSQEFMLKAEFKKMARSIPKCFNCDIEGIFYMDQEEYINNCARTSYGRC